MANRIVRKLRKRAMWAARIRAAHKKTVSAFLKLGRMLIAAKKGLAHGEFEEMIAHDLPFTASTAQRLMRIASDPKIAKAARVQHLLPSAWGTLYELSKLSDETFTQAAASGEINPKMRRSDAVRVRRQVSVPYETKTLHITSVGYAKEESEPLSLHEVAESVLLNRLQQFEDVAAYLCAQHGITSTSDFAKRMKAVRDQLNQFLSLIEQQNAATVLTLQ